MLALLSFICGTSRNATPKQSNLLRELDLLFPHLVDPLDQVHVVLHESCIAFSVLLKTAGELAAVVHNVLLIGFTFTRVLSTLIGSLGPLACLLFLDPGLVEAHNSPLQFLVVRDVLDNFEYIFLETLFR